MNTIPTVLVSDASNELTEKIENLIRSQPELSFISTVSFKEAKRGLPAARLIWLELESDPEGNLDDLASLIKANPDLAFIVSKESLDTNLVKRSMQIGALDFLDHKAWAAQIRGVIRRISSKDRSRGPAPAGAGRRPPRGAPPPRQRTSAPPPPPAGNRSTPGGPPPPSKPAQRPRRKTREISKSGPLNDMARRSHTKLAPLTPSEALTLSSEEKEIRRKEDFEEKSRERKTQAPESKSPEARVDKKPPPPTNRPTPPPPPPAPSRSNHEDFEQSSRSGDIQNYKSTAFKGPNRGPNSGTEADIEPIDSPRAEILSEEEQDIISIDADVVEVHFEESSDSSTDEDDVIELELLSVETEDESEEAEREAARRGFEESLPDLNDLPVSLDSPGFEPGFESMEIEDNLPTIDDLSSSGSENREGYAPEPEMDNLGTIATPDQFDDAFSEGEPEGRRSASEPHFEDLSKIAADNPFDGIAPGGFDNDLESQTSRSELESNSSPPSGFEDILDATRDVDHLDEDSSREGEWSEPPEPVLDNLTTIDMPDQFDEASDSTSSWTDIEQPEAQTNLYEIGDTEESYDDYPEETVDSEDFEQYPQEYQDSQTNENSSTDEPYQKQDPQQDSTYSEDYEESPTQPDENEEFTEPEFDQVENEEDDVPIDDLSDFETELESSDSFEEDDTEFEDNGEESTGELLPVDPSQPLDEDDSQDTRSFDDSEITESSEFAEDNLDDFEDDVEELESYEPESEAPPKEKVSAANLLQGDGLDDALDKAFSDIAPGFDDQSEARLDEIRKKRERLGAESTESEAIAAEQGDTDDNDLENDLESELDRAFDNLQEKSEPKDRESSIVTRSKWGDLDKIPTPGSKSEAAAENKAEDELSTRSNWEDLDAITAPAIVTRPTVGKWDNLSKAKAAPEEIPDYEEAAPDGEAPPSDPTTMSKWGDLDAIPAPNTSDSSSGTFPLESRWGDLDAITGDEVIAASEKETEAETDQGTFPLESRWGDLDAIPNADTIAAASKTNVDPLPEESRWGNLDAIPTPKGTEEKPPTAPGPLSSGLHERLVLKPGDALVPKAKSNPHSIIGRPQSAPQEEMKTKMPEPTLDEAGSGKWGNLDSIPTPKSTSAESSTENQWGDLNKIPTPGGLNVSQPIATTPLRDGPTTLEEPKEPRFTPARIASYSTASVIVLTLMIFWFAFFSY